MNNYLVWLQNLNYATTYALERNDAIVSLDESHAEFKSGARLTHSEILGAVQAAAAAQKIETPEDNREEDE